MKFDSEAAISLADEENNNNVGVLTDSPFEGSASASTSADDNDSTRSDTRDDRIKFNLNLTTDTVQMEQQETTNSIILAIYNCQQTIREFLNKPPIENTIISLIIINALMLGIGTFDFITKNTQAQGAFEIIDFIFLVVFTVEVVLRLFAEAKSFYRDFWLLFDFFLIASSWMSAAGIGSNLVALRGKYLV